MMLSMMLSRDRYLPFSIVFFLSMLGGIHDLNGAAGPKGVRVQSVPRIDPDYKPRLGTYYYLFELNGLNIGTGWITITKDAERYRIQFNARTNKTADRFYKARYSGEGIMEADPLMPVRTRLHQRVKSKRKDTTIYFEDKGRIITVEKKTEDGEEPEDEVRETRAEGFTLDPFSATYLIQGTDWEMGEEKVFDVYTGKARYETRFTCTDMAAVDIAGLKRTAWVINHESRNLDEAPEEDREKQKPNLKIYVSADELREVLMVETTRKIGHIIITLNRFEPEAGPAPAGDPDEK